MAKVQETPNFGSMEIRPLVQSSLEIDFYQWMQLWLLTRYNRCASTSWLLTRTQF